MTSQRSTPADPEGPAPERRGGPEEPDDSRRKPLEQLDFSDDDSSAATIPEGFISESGISASGISASGGADPSAASESHLDAGVVDELTRRLPTAELVKIIKGALECGRRNRPFTESDLLRAMTFGSGAVPVLQPAPGTRAPRR